MANDKPGPGHNEADTGKKQNPNLNPQEFLRPDGNIKLSGTTGPDITGLGFPSRDRFDGLVAYAGDGPRQKKDTSEKTSNKDKLKEQLNSFGKTAQRLSPLIDFMPSVQSLHSENKDNNSLVIQINSLNSSKLPSLSGGNDGGIRLKSVEIAKDVKFTLNEDGKLTDISGIKINGSSVPEFRVGGLMAREPFSANVLDATMAREDGKDYLVATVAPFPDFPNEKHKIRIPLKGDRAQELAKSHPDDKYPKLSLKQLTQIAEVSMKDPQQSEKFKNDLKEFDALAKGNDIPQIMIDKAYGQWSRLLQYKGEGPLSKEQMINIAATRLAELTNHQAPYLQTEDFVDDLKKEVDSAFRGKVRPNF